KAPSRLKTDIKDVHYLARQRPRGFDTGRTPLRMAPLFYGFSPRERIDVPSAYVQAEGRQQSAKDGELRKIMVADDDDVELARPLLRNATSDGTLRVQRA